jgi:hypothetical protein
MRLLGTNPEDSHLQLAQCFNSNIRDMEATVNLRREELEIV